MEYLYEADCLHAPSSVMKFSVIRLQSVLMLYSYPYFIPFLLAAVALARKLKIVPHTAKRIALQVSLGTIVNMN